MDHCSHLLVVKLEILLLCDRVNINKKRQGMTLFKNTHLLETVTKWIVMFIFLPFQNIFFKNWNISSATGIQTHDLSIKGGQTIILPKWCFTRAVFDACFCDGRLKYILSNLQYCILPPQTNVSNGLVPVCRDLANFHHFGKKFRVFGNLFEHKFGIGQILSLLWQKNLQFWAYSSCSKWPNIEHML